MTLVAANAKKPGEERLNGEKAEARQMASKGETMAVTLEVGKRRQLTVRFGWWRP